MSLVLEALKKQQADDDPDTAVALALGMAAQRRQRNWQIVLAIALLLNAAVLVWLFHDRKPETTGPIAGPAADRVAEPAPAVVPASPPPPVAVGPVAAPAGSAVQPAVSPAAPATAPGAMQGNPLGATYPGQYAAQPALPPTGVGALPEAAPPRVLERIALDSLPPAARARFPGIVISTHVYAEDPAVRAIVVNGTRLQEGDVVSGLTIREINEFGVVVEFESYLVDVPVFNDW